MDNNEEMGEGLEPSFVPNAEDLSILMHREAHFGGSFPLMIEYYTNQGKGISQEFEVERIQELADYELRANVNLATLLLSGADAEKIKRILDVYKSLRKLYEEENSAKLGPKLIADLILSEEEIPQEEMDAIVAQKGTIVPLLVDLLRSEDFYDPLFPGYGLTPAFAAQCLGRIGDKRALISLFEEIGEEDFFSEDPLLDALKNIGEPAKVFLLKILRSRPINFDNERAAIALVRFKEDPEVAHQCLEMLLQAEVWQEPALALHLILACEGLKDPKDQAQFVKLIEEPKFPKMLHQDLCAIAKTFDR